MTGGIENFWLPADDTDGCGWVASNDYVKKYLHCTSKSSPMSNVVDNYRTMLYCTVPELHIRISGHLQAETAPAHTHRWKTLQMRALQHVLHTVQFAQGAQAHS